MSKLKIKAMKNVIGDLKKILEFNVNIKKDNDYEKLFDFYKNYDLKTIDKEKDNVKYLYYFTIKKMLDKEIKFLSKIK